MEKPVGILIDEFEPLHQGHFEFLEKWGNTFRFVLGVVVNKAALPYERKVQWLRQAGYQGPTRLFYDTHAPHENMMGERSTQRNFLLSYDQNLLQQLDICLTPRMPPWDLEKDAPLNYAELAEDLQKLSQENEAIRSRYLPYHRVVPAARSQIVQKVAIIGPESTGKTQLAQQLAEAYGTQWVPEYGRQYFAERNNRSTFEDISQVAAGQMNLEDQQIPLCEQPFLFCDAELISYAVWSELYFGKVPEWLLVTIAERRHAYYLLLKPDIPWVPDQLRENGHLRQAHFDRLLAYLKAYDMNYDIVGGTGELRLKTAKACFNEFLKNYGRKALDSSWY